MSLMRNRTLALIVFVLVAALGLVGCSGGDDTTGDSGTTDGDAAAPREATVTMQNGAFEPYTVEIALGGTVTFTNGDSVDHQILLDGVTLDRQAPGATVLWVGGVAGTFDYICTLHPEMRGRVVVK
jgi:plastocyanin